MPIPGVYAILDFLLGDVGKRWNRTKAVANSPRSSFIEDSGSDFTPQ